MPPLRISSGDAESPHPLFVSYTEIENMQNFPAVLADGEEVIASEKIHGTNCRVGMVLCDGKMTWMAGSKTVRRKMPVEEKTAADLYWHPYASTNVRALVESVAGNARQVVFFGEVYGKVQSLRYGVPGGIAFRAFDLLVDGKYVDYDQFAERFTIIQILISWRFRSWRPWRLGVHFQHSVRRFTPRAPAS